MRRLAILGLSLAVVAAGLGLCATFGYQTGLLSIRTALLSVLTWAAYTGGAAAGVSALALVGTLLVRQRTRGGLIMATVGLLLGSTVIGIPASLRSESSRNGYPPIHDITTDTTDPPVFVDVLPLRADAPNSVEYEGPKVATQQQKAFPDIQPVLLSVDAGEAFDRALDAVHALGWDLVAANREDGRIEATDTTFWFRFKDDVVVRLRSSEGGTRVDVRSVSRVGGGDVGANAKRIRAFVRRLKSL